MIVKTIALVPLTCFALSLLPASPVKSQQAALSKEGELTCCTKNMPARFAANQVLMTYRIEKAKIFGNLLFANNPSINHFEIV
jgi:hypothetical protein